jgi:hypothetical protein
MKNGLESLEFPAMMKHFVSYLFFTILKVPVE